MTFLILIAFVAIVCLINGSFKAGVYWAMVIGFSIIALFGVSNFLFGGEAHRLFDILKSAFQNTDLNPPNYWRHWN